MLAGKDITVFSGLSVDEANKWLDDRTKKYTKTKDGYKCPDCGSTIQQTTLYMSIHSKMFKSCAGSGEVQTVNFPYCPKCDGKPGIVRACVHV